jgi:acyl-CoA synthetase (AMP-forming)/AMP-acid ligase II
MAVLPFHYCFGTSLLHTHLRVGGSLVIDNRFMYPEAVLQRMRDTECTGFAGVPSHYQILLRRTSFARMSFPHLRYVQQAGGHLAPTFIKELRRAQPQVKVYVMYGQTEATARLAYVPPDLLDEKLGSIGKAIPGVTLRVLNEAGQEVRPGEQGEIVAEGKNIARGYWNDPRETAACFRDGKLYTGDLATVDEDGFIYVVDRAKDFIKCGGKRVSCRNIEEQLLEFEDVLEIAVIGVPDPLLGEAVKIFVVPKQKKQNGFAEHFQSFCKDKLPFQLLPREIVTLESLPKNNAGKILKQVLRNA